MDPRANSDVPLEDRDIDALVASDDGNWELVPIATRLARAAAEIATLTGSSACRCAGPAPYFVPGVCGRCHGETVRLVSSKNPQHAA